MDIVQMSVQAGVLIAAIVIVRAITLYRLPKTSFLALWGIAVARLLIPFSLTSRWSVYNLFAGLWGHEDTTVPTGSYVTVWGGQAQVPALPEAALSIPPLTALWMVGAVVLVVVFAVLLAKNYQALRAAVPVEDHAVITKWREEYRLLRPLAIVRSDKVSSPASCGRASSSRRGWIWTMTRWFAIFLSMNTSISAALIRCGSCWPCARRASTGSTPWSG